MGIIFIMRICIPYNSIKSMVLMLQQILYRFSIEYVVLITSYDPGGKIIMMQGMSQENKYNSSGWAVIGTLPFENLRSNFLPLNLYHVCRGT